MATRVSNRIKRNRPDEHPPTARKVPANSVPFGESISRNGQTVWIAMDGERVVCVGATSDEVRSKCRELIKKGGAKS
jgi:hypothetical protein